jgi:hypothetical protein
MPLLNLVIVLVVVGQTYFKRRYHGLHRLWQRHKDEIDRMEG